MSLPNAVKKHPTETLNIGVDFTNRLAVGETVSSAVATVVGTGTITVGTPVVVTPIVTVPVLGGTDGVTDSLLVDATTNAGEILSAVVDMVVSARDF